MIANATDYSWIVDSFVRWAHVVAGITWIGLLYFFNFINGPFAKTLDGDSKKKVVPELLPRTLYWFRWGAAWTLGTGLILLIFVFWLGGQTIDEQADWTTGGYIMAAVTLLGFLAYDALYKSPLGKNAQAAMAVSFVAIAAIAFLMKEVGNFSYRAFNIHIGAMFGTAMAFNVWYRIWPAQQKIIRAIKNGEAPDGALVGLAGMRSKHNTYLSVPLVWTMLNAHTTIAGSGGKMGLTNSCNWLSLVAVVAVGWIVVFLLYKKSAAVKGF